VPELRIGATEAGAVGDDQPNAGPPSIQQALRRAQDFAS
jgi:hypothetical protein